MAGVSRQSAPWTRAGLEILARCWPQILMGVNRLVTVDASAAVPWIVRAQATASSDGLFQDGLRKLLSLQAPALWLWECGNVFAGLVSSQRLSTIEAYEGLEALLFANVRIHDAPTLQMQRTTLFLAGQFQLSFYDAAYLELAMRTGSELATLDQKLKKAAENSGVLCLSL